MDTFPSCYLPNSSSPAIKSVPFLREYCERPGFGVGVIFF